MRPFALLLTSLSRYVIMKCCRAYLCTSVIVLYKLNFLPPFAESQYASMGLLPVVTFPVSLTYVLYQQWVVTDWWPRTPDISFPIADILGQERARSSAWEARADYHCQSSCGSVLVSVGWLVCRDELCRLSRGSHLISLTLDTSGCVPPFSFLIFIFLTLERIKSIYPL